MNNISLRTREEVLANENYPVKIEQDEDGNNIRKDILDPIQYLKHKIVQDHKEYVKTMKYIKSQHNKQIFEIKHDHDINKNSINEKIEEIEVRINSLGSSINSADIQEIKTKLYKQSQIMQDLQSADTLQGNFLKNELFSKIKKVEMQYKSTFDKRKFQKIKKLLDGIEYLSKKIDGVLETINNPSKIRKRANKMQLTQAWEDERRLEEIKEEDNNENSYSRGKEDEKDVIIKRKGCFYKDEEKISDTLKKTRPIKEDHINYNNNKDEEIRKDEKEEVEVVEEIKLEEDETITDLNTETINKILTKNEDISIKIDETGKLTYKSPHMKKQKILEINNSINYLIKQMIHLCQLRLNENSKFMISLCCSGCYRILDTCFVLFPCAHVICLDCKRKLDINPHHICPACKPLAPVEGFACYDLLTNFISYIDKRQTILLDSIKNLRELSGNEVPSN